MIQSYSRKNKVIKNENVKKKEEFVKHFDHCHHKFNSGHFFSPPVKL